MTAKRLRRSFYSGSHQVRRGTTTVESAVVVSLLLVVLIGTLDVGLAAARHDVLSTAARQLAREAVVHGASAAPERTSWGPAAISQTAASGSAAALVVAEALPTMSLQDVSVEVRWPDGGNGLGDRVWVRLSYTHTGSPLLDLGDGLVLSSECTMRITH